MKIFDKLFGKAPAQHSGLSMKDYVNSTLSPWFTGSARWSERRYDVLAQEGYVENVIGHRCINEIAGSAATVPLLLFQGKKKPVEIETSPLLTLLQRPNPRATGANFTKSILSYRYIAGDSFVYALRPFDDKPPRELHAWRPDRVQIKEGPRGLPLAYVYNVDGKTTTVRVDQISGQSDVLQMREFHPLDDWNGLSPLRTAGRSIDQHNTASEHNQAILQNGARPSGALALKNPPQTFNQPGPDMSESEAMRIFSLLMQRYGGPKKAGKPMVLGGEWEWLEMMMNPRDMDFNNMIHTVTRNICAAFGVPHVLILPGESTYNNRTDARLEMWESVIIPLLDDLCDHYNNWLLPMFDDSGETYLKFDLDAVSALLPRRQIFYQNALAAWNGDLTTMNEAREAIGYEIMKNGEKRKSEERAANYGIPVPGSNAPNGDKKPKPNDKKSEFLELKADDRQLSLFADEIDYSVVYATTAEMLKEALETIILEYGREVADEISDRVAYRTSSKLINYITEHSFEVLDTLNDTTKKKLRGILAEGVENGDTIDQMMTDIRAQFREWKDWRAKMIAQTESTAAAGFASQDAMEQAGIERKEWLTTMDGHARHTHKRMNGQISDINGKFHSPSGDSASHPGGFSTAAENINCRCAIAAVFEGEEKGYTEIEKKELWDRREVKRQSIEDALQPTIVKIFDIQERVVIQRLHDITR